MTAGRQPRPQRPRDLSGAHVAVVGATGALGSRLVEQLHAAGAVVTVVGRDQERLWPLARGGSVVVGDLTEDTLGDRLTFDRGGPGRFRGHPTPRCARPTRALAGAWPGPPVAGPVRRPPARPNLLTGSDKHRQRADR